MIEEEKKKTKKEFYLQRGGSQLQSHQNRPVHQLGYSGVGHLQRVLHQVGDVHLPIGPQHCDDLVGALRRGGVELGQNLDQRPLELQRAASADAALVLLLLAVAVPGAPAWMESSHESEQKV